MNGRPVESPKQGMCGKREKRELKVAKARMQVGRNFEGMSFGDVEAGARNGCGELLETYKQLGMRCLRVLEASGRFLRSRFFATSILLQL